jgi:hypothetical protein
MSGSGHAFTGETMFAVDFATQAWIRLDRGVFHAQLMRAMVRPSLRIDERWQIARAFEDAPDVAWRALDECWPPPGMPASRDPVVLALRHLAMGLSGEAEGTGGGLGCPAIEADLADLEIFAEAHHRTFGFLRIVVAEAVLLGRHSEAEPEERIAPLQIAAALLTPELEHAEPRHYADLMAVLLLEIAARLRARQAPAWMSVLAHIREELDRGTGDARLRRDYLALCNQAAVVVKGRTDAISVE